MSNDILCFIRLMSRTGPPFLLSLRPEKTSSRFTEEGIIMTNIYFDTDTEIPPEDVEATVSVRISGVDPPTPIHTFSLDSKNVCVNMSFSRNFKF